MSHYTLLPSSDIQGKETVYSWWEGGFSQDELTRIISHGNAVLDVKGERAIVGSGNESKENSEIRKSNIAWIQLNEETQWLYDRLGFIARQLNGQYYQFDLTGFYEDLQYTVYNGNENAFYDWHMDKAYAENGAPPRKLSMVLQLSDPNEYEGGNLEIVTGNGTEITSRKQGTVHCFPSYTLHRVSPVTKGTRRTIVVWLCGPKFR